MRTPTAPSSLTQTRARALVVLLALCALTAPLLTTATAQDPGATSRRDRALDFYHRAGEHLESDRRVLAALFFEQAVNADETFAPAQFAYAKLLSEISDEYAVALQSVQAGLEQDEDNLEGLMLGVRLARILGDAPLAYTYALDAFNAHGERVEILLELGTAAFQTGELDVALDAYTRRLAALPGDPESRYNLARIAFLHWESAQLGGNDADERKWRNTFLDWADNLLLPDLPEAPSWWRAEIFGNAVHICLEQRDAAGAAIWAESTVEADPSLNNRLQATLLARVAAGEAGITASKLAPVLGMIDFTGARNPVRHLAEVNAMLDGLGEAGAVVPELHAVAASLAHQVDDYPDVLTHCAAMTELWPVVPEFHLLRARAGMRLAADHAENGNVDACNDVLRLALESYRVMVERDPDSVEFETHVRWIPAAIEGNVPTLAINVYWLGWQLLGEADGAEDALSMLDFALQLAPYWRPALELYAEAAHREREYADAVPCYQRALTLALGEQLDTNRDGALVADELAQRPQIDFDALDANADGRVTLDEFESNHTITALDFGTDREAFASNVAGDREILRSLRGLAVALLLSTEEQAGHASTVAVCESLDQVIDDIETRTLAELARDIRDGNVVTKAFRHYWHSRFASNAADLDRELSAALKAQPTLFEALDSHARVMLREAERFRRDNDPDVVNLRRFEQMLRDTDKAFETAFNNARNDTQRAHAAGGRQLVAMADGDEARALTHAETALSLDPTLVDTRYLYAQQLRISGAAFAAHREIVDVLDRSPGYDAFDATDAARFALRIPADPNATNETDAPRVEVLPAFPPAGTELVYSVECEIASKLAVAQLQRPRFRFECVVLPTPEGEPADPGIAALRVTISWLRDFISDPGVLTGYVIPKVTISNLLGVIDVDWGNPNSAQELGLHAMIGLVGPAFAELWSGAPTARPRAVGDAWRMPANISLQGAGRMDAEFDRIQGISGSEAACWVEAIEGAGQFRQVTLARREQSWSRFGDPVRDVDVTKLFDTGRGRATSATIRFTTLAKDDLGRGLLDWVETTTTTSIREE